MHAGFIIPQGQSSASQSASAYADHDDVFADDVVVVDDMEAPAQGNPPPSPQVSRSNMPEPLSAHTAARSPLGAIVSQPIVSQPADSDHSDNDVEAEPKAPEARPEAPPEPDVGESRVQVQGQVQGQVHVKDRELDSNKEERQSNKDDDDDSDGPSSGLGARIVRRPARPAADSESETAPSEHSGNEGDEKDDDSHADSPVTKEVPAPSTRATPATAAAQHVSTSAPSSAGSSGVRATRPVEAARDDQGGPHVVVAAATAPITPRTWSGRGAAAGAGGRAPASRAGACYLKVNTSHIVSCCVYKTLSVPGDTIASDLGGFVTEY